MSVAQWRSHHHIVNSGHYQRRNRFRASWEPLSRLIRLPRRIIPQALAPPGCRRVSRLIRPMDKLAGLPPKLEPLMPASPLQMEAARARPYRLSSRSQPPRRPFPSSQALEPLPARREARSRRIKLQRPITRTASRPRPSAWPFRQYRDGTDHRDADSDRSLQWDGQCDKRRRERQRALVFTITLPKPVITSAGTASGVSGSAFTYQITATNSPSSYGASGLAPGLAINTTTGKITGTPSQVGTFTATISATNSGGSGSAPLAMTITAISASGSCHHESRSGLRYFGKSYHAVSNYGDKQPEHLRRHRSSARAFRECRHRSYHRNADPDRHVQCLRFSNQCRRYRQSFP